MNAYPMVFLIVFVAIIFRLERMAMRFAAEGERTKALVFLWFAGFLILAAATLQLVLNH